MKRLITLVFASAALLLAGCISAPLPPADRRVTLSPEVTGKVMVTDIRCAKGTSDFLTFQANVANLCDSQYPVQWSVRWFDANGVEIDSVVSSWDARMLQPFEVHALKATAPRPDAADMMLYVRRAK